LRTFGKALGCEGAVILGSATVCEMLVNRGRGFIFSTAPSPLIAAVARAALRIVGQSEDRRSQLDARVDYATRAFARLGVTPSGSAIQPVVIGDDRAAMAIASALQADGFDVRGIRPPTVPVGTARLRVSLTLNTDEAAISDLVAALAHRL
jgi:8-amino-7-oxononanoate synthase